MSIRQTSYQLLPFLFAHVLQHFKPSCLLIYKACRVFWLLVEQIVVVLQHLCQRVGTNIVGCNVAIATMSHAIADILVRNHTRIMKVSRKAVSCPLEHCKFKIEVQFFCSVSQANTMKNTAEVCPSGRRRKAS